MLNILATHNGAVGLIIQFLELPLKEMINAIRPRSLKIRINIIFEYYIVFGCFVYIEILFLF